jgi:membrane glycosyltransferase
MLLASLVGATTSVGALVFYRHLEVDGIGLLDLALMGFFVVLFLWIAFGFWTATMGFFYCLWRPGQAFESAERPPEVSPSPFRTAIVMPIYNEDPTQVFACLEATIESLLAAGDGALFDVFILSDTKNASTWLEEELAWAKLRATVDGRVHVYYRHRPQNIARKSGNIAEFCERWGAAYRYMIVLDADSIMAGPTLTEMVRRMEVDPRIGLLQAPPIPVNRRSVFARSQQFAASVYGDMFTTGLALWSAADGNYWGHNAIIRIAPFMEHCDLPQLPGPPPLGGEVLSHDFVEAALLLRAGWKVVIAHDLQGSYEECPPSLTAFAQRDQRWCQGNLQHVRLVLRYGFHPVSRLHLGMGAMSYISSLLWFIFIVLGVLAGIGVGAEQTPPTTAIADVAPVDDVAPSNDVAPAEDVAPVAPVHRGLLWLALLTAGLLLVPKLWGYILLLRDGARLRLQGGALKAAASVLFETLISILVAPIFMAFHATFVVTTLLGHRVEWNAQARGESDSTFSESVRTFILHTLGGLIAAFVVAWLAPALFWWMSPILVGLIFSIPIAAMLASPRIGDRLRASEILLIPEETATPEVLRLHQAFLSRRPPARAINPLLRVVVDPRFNALHLGALPPSPRPADAGDEALERVRNIALHGGPRYLTHDHQVALLSDAASLRWLHRAVWREWPVKTLAAALPADAGN